MSVLWTHWLCAGGNYWFTIRFSSTAAEYPHVSQQMKQLEEDTTRVLKEVNVAKSSMGRVLSAWDSYTDCLSSQQAWLEQSSVRRSLGQRAQVSFLSSHPFPTFAFMQNYNLCAKYWTKTLIKCATALEYITKTFYCWDVFVTFLKCNSHTVLKNQRGWVLKSAPCTFSF